MSSNHDSILAQFNHAQDSLVLQASDLSLDTIAYMVDAGSIDVSPSYQRRERWGIQKQRDLIESFLMNIPVPPVYLFEEDYGVYSVIDGKQRIVAIHQFMRGNLDLKHMTSFPLLDGQTINLLPIHIQNALRVRPYLRVVTLLRQSDPDLKYEVFRRLNEGGEPLNAQEIRNVVYRGSLNDLILRLSENKFLKEQMKIRGSKDAFYRQMFNVEVVLRYFVLFENWRDFSGSFRESMDRYMHLYQSPSDKMIAELDKSFLRAIDGCRNVFGRFAFKRPTSEGWRDQFLTGMYDAQMIAIACISDEKLNYAMHSKHIIQQNLHEMFSNDTGFSSAIREATNTPSRIRHRIECLISLFN